MNRNYQILLDYFHNLDPLSLKKPIELNSGDAGVFPNLLLDFTKMLSYKFYFLEKSLIIK